MTDYRVGEIEKLISYLYDAVDLAYNENRSLFQMTGIERSMVFRIGCHLNALMKKHNFNHLDLDSEYNKNKGQLKTTKNLPKGIRPDLLIHKRDTNDANMLAIEFKGHWNKDRKNDIQKLKDLTSKQDGYNYLLGVLVELGLDGPEYTCFQNGKIVKS